MKPTNKHAAVGAGRNRNHWGIRAYLAEIGKNMRMVADDLGVASSLVQDTVRGIKNNRRVLAYLLELGCPRKYLSLPPDLDQHEKEKRDDS